MDFLNKLGKKASDAYKVTADKTGKLAKEAKLRMKINELKNEIDDEYKEIGKIFYQNYIREEKQDITKQLEEKCIKINCLSDEIETNLKECLELKDKKRCSNCYIEIEKDVKFCPECGAKQEEKTNLEQTVEVESNVNLEEEKTNEQIETEESGN